METYPELAAFTQDLAPTERKELQARLDAFDGTAAGVANGDDRRQLVLDYLASKNVGE